MHLRLGDLLLNRALKLTLIKLPKMHEIANKVSKCYKHKNAHNSTLLPSQAAYQFADSASLTKQGSYSIL